MQQILMDRRLVLKILDGVGIPTPSRLVSQKPDDLPNISQNLVDEIYKKFGIDISNNAFVPSEVVQVDADTIRVGDKFLKKPFVEKPVSGEDHNINIYYSSSQGGGVRRLFRKVSSI